MSPTVYSVSASCSSNAGLLGVELLGGDETQFVVVDFDVAADRTGRHPAGADDRHALLDRRGTRIQSGGAHVAVANAGDDQSLGSARERCVYQSAVHVGVGVDNLDGWQRGFIGYVEDGLALRV